MSAVGTAEDFSVYRSGTFQPSLRDWTAWFAQSQQ